MDEINGFALSQEELLAALLIAGLPLPVGADALEAQVFGELPPVARGALLAAAERSLIARGALDASVTPPQLAPEIAAGLTACARPLRTWLIVHQAVGQGDRASYINQGDLIIAHTSSAGIHQFLALASPAEVVTLTQELTGTPASATVVPLGGTLPEALFAALVALEPPDTAASAAELRDAGVGPEAAARFGRSLADRRAITACARLEHSATPPLRQVFTVVSGAADCWVLSPHDATTLRLTLVGHEVLAALLARFGAAE